MNTWHITAIEKSQAITDAWSVVKAYAGRAAEPVLFFCMLGNIAQILPGVSLPLACSNLILGIQAVTLDVAGLALSTLAEQAESQGAAQAAKRARLTGYFLIGLMMTTIGLVTVALLWPSLRAYTAPADNVLILVRVLSTVIYSHVVHGLRRYDTAPVQATAAQPAQAAPVDNLKDWLAAQLAEQERRLSSVSEQVAALGAHLANAASEQTAKNVVNIEQYRGSESNAFTPQETPRGDAQQRALHIISNHPGIGPSELARKAQISKGYAHRILAQATAK
jgi:hypothetical protein